MSDPKPLWEVMRQAFLAGLSPGLADRFGFAAELRAIADAASLEFSRIDEACEVIEWLRTEADRAEAGE